MKKFHTAVLGLAAGAAIAFVATSADANGRRSIRDGPPLPCSGPVVMWVCTLGTAGATLRAVQATSQNTHNLNYDILL